MIDIETLTRLKTMRLSGMAEYFENLAEATGVGKLTGPEMVKQAVDWERSRRRPQQPRPTDHPPRLRLPLRTSRPCAGDALLRPD